MPNYTDADEYHVITKLENELAVAHGLDPRDEHDIAGSFETGGVLSVEPVSAEVKALLALRMPALRQLTGVMDQRGMTLDNVVPSEEQSRIFNQRADLAHRLFYDLAALDPVCPPDARQP